MKNLTQLTGDWTEMKEKLKQQFTILTDDDLLLIDGKQDEMVERLQARLGKTKEAIHTLISEL